MSSDSYRMDNFETYGAEIETESLAAEVNVSAGIEAAEAVMTKDQWKQLAKPASAEAFRRKALLSASYWLLLFFLNKFDFSFPMYMFAMVVYLPLSFWLSKRIDEIAYEKFDFECPLCGAGITPSGKYARGFSWHSLNQDGKCPKCRGQIVESDSTRTSKTTIIIAVGLVVVMIVAIFWFFLFQF